MRFILLIVIMLMSLSPLYVSNAFGGLGTKWWAPDNVDFYVLVKWGRVEAYTDTMYWLANQYATEEQSRGVSLSYVHEHRTDYNMLEGDGYWSTDLPPPITYTNSIWLEEIIDGYEEVEVIAEEPELIQTSSEYFVYASFDTLAVGEDNYMEFEGELGEDRWYYQNYPIDYYVYGRREFFQYPPPPPGGCPYVNTWDGARWLLDNNLIPAAEHSNGTDVVDYYRLHQPLARNEGKYSLLISDTDKHSFLDQVRLLAVDHKADVNVAVSPYGEILTYRSPASPVTAISQDGEDLTSILGVVDGRYFEGGKDDYVTLDFGNLDTSNGAKLVLRTDPDHSCELNPCKESIHVQIFNSTGYWSDVASFIPRIYWATDIIDLSSYLPDANGDLKVRLYFTANHNIDYVGLDTTAQAQLEQQYANLATANHSRLGDVKDLFKNSDNLRVELLPGDHVALQFTAPQLKEQKRDFIIILEGHYFTIS